jgi:hypothetical protein
MLCMQCAARETRMLHCRVESTAFIYPSGHSCRSAAMLQQMQGVAVPLWWGAVSAAVSIWLVVPIAAGVAVAVATACR